MMSAVVWIILITVSANCAVAQGKTLPRTTVNEKDGSELVWIPAGEFVAGGMEDGSPRHKVFLKGYWIGKYEVTNAQYGRFVGTTGRRLPKYWRDERFNHPTQPVVGVTWQDACDYASWAGLRLPTQAEWEKAARGCRGRTYPWGNGPPGNNGRFRANFSQYHETEDGFKFAAPVGSFRGDTSPYGCLDMAGNVLEWCMDVYDAVAAEAKTGKTSGSGQKRVVKGGGWLTFYPEGLCSAECKGYAPDVRIFTVGFRCAASQGALKGKTDVGRR